MCACFLGAVWIPLNNEYTYVLVTDDDEKSNQNANEYHKPIIIIFYIFS